MHKIPDNAGGGWTRFDGTNQPDDLDAACRSPERHIGLVRVRTMLAQTASDLPGACAGLGNVTEARTLLIPLNYRIRLPDFTADDAGNYEGALVFGPEEYANPAEIRRTLNSGPPKFQRGIGLPKVRPLPSGCEAMRCR